MRLMTVISSMLTYFIHGHMIFYMNLTSNIMDGLTAINEIATIFSEKYDDLYNCVSYNTDDMNRLKDDLKARISNECHSSQSRSNHHHSITVKELKDAVSMLKL